jgi:hypothetical protein
MQKSLSSEKYMEVRGYFKDFTKVLVPKALVVAVASGIYLFFVHFGSVGEAGLSSYQLVLLLKAFFGLWLGARGILQVFFGIDPFVFKSHRLPFILVILIIALSQIMMVV